MSDNINPTGAPTPPNYIPLEGGKTSPEVKVDTTLLDQLFPDAAPEIKARFADMNKKAGEILAKNAEEAKMKEREGFFDKVMFLGQKAAQAAGNTAAVVMPMVCEQLGNAAQKARPWLEEVAGNIKERIQEMSDSIPSSAQQAQKINDFETNPPSIIGAEISKELSADAKAITDLRTAQSERIQKQARLMVDGRVSIEEGEKQQAINPEFVEKTTSAVINSVGLSGPVNSSAIELAKNMNLFKPDALKSVELLPDDKMKELFGTQIDAIFTNNALSKLFFEIEPDIFGFKPVNRDILASLEKGLDECYKRNYLFSAVLRNFFDENDFANIDKRVETINYAKLRIFTETAQENLPECDKQKLEAFTQKFSFNIKNWIGKINYEGEILDVVMKDYTDFISHHHNKPPQGAGIINNADDNLFATHIYLTSLSKALDDIEASHLVFLKPKEKEFKELLAIKKDVNIPDSSRLLDVWPDDVFGESQREYLQQCLDLAENTAGFDMETKKNPADFNQVKFGQGPPGCGKTIIAHAALNHFKKLCDENGIPCTVRVITRNDWASSFQNESSQKLLKIFKETVLDFDGVSAVYIPDIDSMFGSRDEPGQSRGEEKFILQTVFGLFDGTILPKNGKWFVICDANYMNMDKATISRVCQDPSELRNFDKPEEFIEMTKKKLSKKLKFIDLDEAQWQEIGKSMSDYHLSGRNVEGIIKNISKEIETFKKPKEYFKATFEEKKKMIEQLSKHIGFDRFKEIVNHFVEFEKAVQEKADKDAVDAETKRLIKSYEASKQAEEQLTKQSELSTQP